jgi:hypothetical protein
MEFARDGRDLVKNSRGYGLSPVLDLIEDPSVKPGGAELRSSEGDRWRFRWDPRWRCGGCGRELPNSEQHNPAYVTPYCGACARIKRPGMYLPEEDEAQPDGEPNHVRVKQLMEYGGAQAAADAADTLATYLEWKRPDLEESALSIRTLGSAIRRSIVSEPSEKRQNGTS